MFQDYFFISTPFVLLHTFSNGVSRAADWGETNRSDTRRWEKGNNAIDPLKSKEAEQKIKRVKTGDNEIKKKADGKT